MNNKSTKIILIILVASILVSVLGYETLVRKPISTGQIQYTQSTTSVPVQQNTAQALQVIKCGSISQKILTQSDYQPTQSEKESAITSLTCINQAIIKCSPASLAIQNSNGLLSISVEGEGKSGCNVSVPKSVSENIICPLPPTYITELQNKFLVKNYDATIITNLVTDMNAEINSGNKSGSCTVTNTK